MASGASGRGGTSKNVTRAENKSSAAPRPIGSQKGGKDKKGGKREVTAEVSEDEDTVSSVEDQKNKLPKVEFGASSFTARPLHKLSAEGQQARSLRNNSTPITEAAEFLKRIDARKNIWPESLPQKIWPKSTLR